MRSATCLLALAALVLPSVLEALETTQPPRPIRVFTFSRDSAAGFADENLDIFRREVGSQLDDFMEVAYGRDDADVEVQFLGHGELTLELGASGEPERHLFRLDDDAANMWVLLRIRGFTKEFSWKGRGARDTARLARTVAEWLKAHRTQLRELVNAPGG